MKLTDEQINKMEQWRVTMALMGVSLDDIDDDDWQNDEKSFVDLLEELENFYASLAHPSTNMKAVLQTREMDVTFDEVDDYRTYLNQIEEERLEQEREYRIATNENLVSLHEQYALQFVTSKQYPTHTHFKFNDRKGLEIKGRTFKPTWGKVRVWLYWKDTKGKLQSLCKEYSMYSKDIRYPSGFPKDWSEHSEYTIEPRRVAYVIAHRIINRIMSRDVAAANFVYPSKGVKK
jgi:hypothetical protein